jgi:hypothetical protein
LPAVRIRIRGKVEDGAISGIRLAFPIVSVDRGKGEHEGYEFAWGAIVHSLNEGTPLIA